MLLYKSDDIKIEGDALYKIAKVPRYTFNYQLGKIITQTRLENSYTIYSSNTTKSQFA